MKALCLTALIASFSFDALAQLVITGGPQPPAPQPPGTGVVSTTNRFGTVRLRAARGSWVTNVSGRVSPPGAVARPIPIPTGPTVTAPSPGGTTNATASSYARFYRRVQLRSP